MKLKLTIYVYQIYEIKKLNVSIKYINNLEKNLANKTMTFHQTYRHTPTQPKVKSKSVSQHTTQENHQTIEEEIKRRRNEWKTIKTRKQQNAKKVHIYQSLSVNETNIPNQKTKGG